MANETGWEQICPVCGKHFFPTDQHVYSIKVRRTNKKGVMLSGFLKKKVCSWKCQCEYEKQVSFEEADHRRTRFRKQKGSTEVFGAENA